MSAALAIVGTSSGSAYSRSIRSRARRRCARSAISSGVTVVDVDEVAVGGVVGRRRRTEEAGAPGVVLVLDRTGGQPGALVVARALRQLGHARRQGRDRPVPEARAGGRVGVVDGDRVA